METTRNPIILLPEVIQNQIAAGEVVERPANVVKELIENSLDAQSTRIDVSIENGGQTLIKVQDNGIGIPSNELRIAFSRHATNKITSMDDLWKIRSFGFRGEALPSIASVSSLKIESAFSKNGKTEASFLKIEHGAIKKEGPAALYQGTIITVQDLFTSLPVRLKFLKTPSTEQKRIQELFSRIALVNKAEMRLSVGTREILKFSAAESIEKRLCTIWPETITSQLYHFEKTIYGIKIHGFTSPPKQTQSRADKILLYVNNRVITDKLILRAIRDAYKGKLLSNEYPQTVLFIDIPSEQIDVNVHPTKTEVRFREEKNIFLAVTTTLKEVLTKNMPQISSSIMNTTLHPNGFWGKADQEPIFSQKKYVGHDIMEPNTVFTDTPTLSPSLITEKQHLPLEAKVLENKKDTYSTHENHDNHTNALINLEENSLPHTPKTEQNKKQTYIGQYTYIGQINETYLLLIDAHKKNEESLIILDQHAVHERILLMKILDGSLRGLAQNLVLPIQLTLHPTEHEYLQDIRDTLLTLGFHFSKQGNNLNVQAIPHLLDRSSATTFLKKSLSGQEKDLIKFWLSIACKKALKSGTKLTHDEAALLIKKWLQTEEKEFCPHGRPCFLIWTTHELETWFKRK